MKPEELFPAGEPSGFQAAAVEKIQAVLEKHGIKTEGFRLNLGARKAYWASFPFRGEEHTVAVYDDNVNMQQGPNLFECYMPDEFKSDASLIEGFSSRLDRYLSGGDWAGEGEEGPLAGVRKRLAQAFGRRE